MNVKKSIYFIGWLAYLGFSYSLFPILNITVMLASIPLTMLGGWSYSYSGAGLTILLTIPYHYVLLALHSDYGDLTNEAFNPFGIMLQMLFSFIAAYLKITQDRYIDLNNSLEAIVHERTKDLERLNACLIDAEDDAYDATVDSLLKLPLKQLRAMQENSFSLYAHLVQINHPESGKAQNVLDYIKHCIESLLNMENHGLKNRGEEKNLGQNICDLAKRFTVTSGVRVIVETSDSWEKVACEKTNHLLHIIYEAVSNACRHAEPSLIRIGIERTENTHKVYVENDGLPLPSSVEKGMGLPLMRYRAEKIGAVLNIIAGEDRNTRVECHLTTDSEFPRKSTSRFIA